MFNGFVCKCLDNWEGPTCETDVNECSRFAGTDLGCQNGATCYNSIGGYRCKCTANWHGVHCTQTHDDCNSGSTRELCGHGTCVNVARVQPGQAKYYCICEQGWTTRAGSPACIQDVDECSSLTSSCSVNPAVQCINVPGSFYCGPCPTGYTGNGYSCSDVDECLVNNGGCSQSPRVDCINTRGSRQCGPCPAGYAGNGVSCLFVGICRINNAGCHPLATCTDNLAISASYRMCRCPSGYYGTGIGPNGCTRSSGSGVTAPNVTPANPCLRNPPPCGNGVCYPMGMTYQCVCNPGYTGPSCGVHIEPCSSNPCKNGGTCVRGSGTSSNTHTCTCTSDYTGDNCDQAQQSCGGSLNNPAGSFRYPHTPNVTYPGSRSCAWTIRTAIGKVLKITFQKFHLESSIDCNFDFLQINDGPNAGARVIGRFCGTTPPSNGTLISTHNFIYFWFHSDSSIQHDGFEVVWNTTDPVCGRNLAVAEYGSINSPGYPGQYPNKRDCYWIVRVPMGKRIQFHFATLQIERHADCSYDYLQLRDGMLNTDLVLETYCTTVTPRPITTSGSYALLHFHSDNSLNDNGFHITYSSVPGIPGCGGTVTTARGTLTSPNFPGRYNNGLECDWLIRVHPDEKIKISFKEFNIESHKSCRFDYVEIRDGDDEQSPLLGKHCGDTIPPSSISNSNTLWIRFKTDNSVKKIGFQISFETVCGGTYRLPSGIIKSPGYPITYPNDRKCNYIITAPAGNVIKLEFQHFDVEGPYHCAHDYLHVRDGYSETDKLIAKLCGDGMPLPIISTFNHLWMEFKTDTTVQKAGFFANYTFIDIGCGGILNKRTDVITSPNHPENYPDNSLCTWIIRAPSGYVIRLSFTLLNIETSSNCQNDYIEVNDTSGATIGRFCGSSMPPTLTSTGNTLSIAFKADQRVVYEGFSAAYVFVNGSSLCGANYFLSIGFINSPNYPNFYPTGRDCVWTIKVKDNHQIMLHVKNFHLENNTDCRFDFLEIRNGISATSPLIGRYCGLNIPPLIPSHTNVIHLRFKSDNSLTAPGFKIYYDGTSTGCGGELSTPTGSIWSPNYPQLYGHQAECSWKIIVSKGSRVQVTFVDFDIEHSSKCSYDYLDVYSGNSDLDKKVGRYCNGNKPYKLDISGNTFLKFVTDISNSGRGFHIEYHLNCTNTLTETSGVIESPNFPNKYPDNRNCSWTIEVPKGNNISIAFSHLHIEPHPNCDFDFVQIIAVDRKFKTQTQVVKYCGSEQVTEPVIVPSSIAIVRFVSDFYVAMNGFRLEYATKGCGGDYSGSYGSYGSFTSPNYPRGYPHNTMCIWTINVQPGKQIILSIEDFDLELSHTFPQHPTRKERCRFDYLKVYRSKEDTSPLLTLCHTSENTQSVTSPGNHLYVVFQSDFAVLRKGFRAHYRTQNAVCGGSYKSVHGTLMSTNYPRSYPENTDCSWSLSVAVNHLVSLTFEDFDMGRSTNCTDNYIALYSGSSTSARLIKKLCGPSIPQPATFESLNNNMYVRMLSNGRESHKGFKASFVTGCGARINVDKKQQGVISSPNYPYTSDFRHCSWTLFTNTPGERIILTVTNLYSKTSDVNCTYVSVTIRDGDSNTSPIRSKFCGESTVPSIISKGSALHVSFSRSIPGKKFLFRAVYSEATSACGGMLTSTQGTFTSPSYPSNYPALYECTWNVRASRGNTMTLSFSHFDVESSDYCNKDYVEIRKSYESGMLIGRYCGTEIPYNLNTSDNFWIRFKSDDSISGRGFMAHYSLLKNIELTESNGVIQNSRYPGYNYGKDAYTYLITRSASSHIRVSFSVLNIESHKDDCSATYVQFFDGPDENGMDRGRYCGYVLPTTIVSYGNQLFIKYQPSINRASKWSLYWYSSTYGPSRPSETSTNRITDCGGDFRIPFVTENENVTYITSPGYPNGYGKNLRCTYRITSPAGTRISIRINHMDLTDRKWTSYCPDDKLSVYQIRGFRQDWSKMRDYCTNRRYYQLSTTVSNEAKLVFTTGNSGNRTGFNISVSSLCGGEFHKSNGIIEFEDSLGTLFTCVWTINVKTGRTIKIKFQEFNIPSDASCSNNYITFRNGNNDDSPFLGAGKYCGTEKPNVPESSSNKLKIKFYKSGQPAKLKFTFEEVSLSCGGQLFVSEANPSGIISSPNYPNAMPHDAECVWVVMGPALHRFLIIFDPLFDLPSSCYKNFVEVRDGGTVHSPIIGKRWCYYTHPEPTFSTKNLVYVRYTTNSVSSAKGFRLNVTIAKCGGSITDRQGILTSPNFPNVYEPSLDCLWLFNGMYNRILVITFNSLDLPSSANCSDTDNLEIRNRNPTGRVLGIFCGQTAPSTEIRSTFNTLLLRFRTSASTTGHKGFNISYVQERNDCGGTLTTPSGIITSPNYPYGIHGYKYCRWKITVPVGRRISISFLDFKLGIPTRKSCGYRFEIYDGDSQSVPKHKICQTGLPDNYDSSGNTMMIILSSPNVPGSRGFKLTYSSNMESLCGGQLTSMSGTFQSPNVDYGGYNDTIACKWALPTILDKNFTIAINFDQLHTYSKAKHVGYRQSDCFNQDYLILRNADSYYSSPVKYYCGNYSSLTTFVSAKQRLSMNYAQKQKNFDYNGYGVKGSYKINPCGGKYSGNYFEFASPNYPSNYPTEYDCLWIIGVPYGSTINITFTDFHLEDDCNRDYVRIENGQFPDSPVIGTYCGQSSPSSFTAFSNNIRVQFHSDSSGSAKGFRFTVEALTAGCGGLIHDGGGTIRSPNYPRQYPNNVECEWILTMSYNYHHVLTFSGRFDIEKQENCDNDYLKMYNWRNGAWTESIRYCGLNNPPRFIADSYKMKLLFHSNQAITGSGFRLYYRTVCGGMYLEGEGIISSPNFPQTYPQYINCNYTIKTDPNNYIRLIFDERFKISGTFGSCTDSLTIYTDSGKSIVKHCGSTSPGHITARGRVTLDFVTSYRSTDRDIGFKVDYKVINCGGNMTGTEGFISLPDHIDTYDANINCTWFITVPSKYNVMLILQKIEREDRSWSCSNKHIEVRDGHSMSDPLLFAKYCSNRLYMVKSSDNEMLVVKRTSISGSFHAVYKSTYGERQGCGGLLQNMSLGALNSIDVDGDGKYEPNLDCVWRISVASDKIIKLTFTSFYIEESPSNMSRCSYDYVEVRDGFFSTSSLIFKLCGSNPPGLIISSGNTLFLHFHSDDVGNFAGFTAHYEVQDPVCGGSIEVTNQTTTLTSPGYPSNYGNNLRCLWRIHSSVPDRAIDIEFTDFDFAGDGSCSDDYLLISFDRMDVATGRFCGRTLPFRFAKDSIIFLLFSSDSSVTAKGFSASLSFENCNRRHSAENGVVEYSSRREKRNCTVTITAPVSHTISLYFDVVNFLLNCNSFSYMQVRDGSNSSAPALTGRLCSDTLPSVFSSSNNLWLDFYFNHDYDNVVRLDYTTTDKGPGCGGKLSMYHGVFTSPNLPYNHTTSSLIQCDWQVEVANGHTINMWFESFNFESTPGCTINYVELYHGSEPDARNKIGRFCGDDRPAPQSSLRNTMLVRMYVSSSTTSLGFRARFRMNMWDQPGIELHQ